MELLSGLAKRAFLLAVGDMCGQGRLALPDAAQPDALFGLKKHKNRPKAAANDLNPPILPQLFFRCQIVSRISTDFFRIPLP